MRLLAQIFFFLVLALPSFGQTVGGAGWCKTSVNPNTITSLRVVNQRNMCSNVWDTLARKMYYYDYALTVGSRWVEFVPLGPPIGAETKVEAGTGIGVSGNGTIATPYIISNTGDLSNTNEIQRLDTFTIVSGVLRASLLNDGVPFSSVTLPTADGSETQVNAGTAIGISGIGTTGSPYVVTNTADLSVTPGGTNALQIALNTSGQTPIFVKGMGQVIVTESATGDTIKIGGVGGIYGVSDTTQPAHVLTIAAASTLTFQSQGDNAGGIVPFRVKSDGSEPDIMGFYANGDSLIVSRTDTEFLLSSASGVNIMSGAVLSLQGDSVILAAVDAALSSEKTYLQITTGGVVKSTEGIPLDHLTQSGATTGQVVKWNGTAWVPDTDAGGDNWGSQVVQTTGTTLSGNGTLALPLFVPTGGITATEILDGTILNADVNASANIANSKLANSGVTAGTYPSTGGVIPLLTINSKGIITAVSESPNVDASATNEGVLGVGAGSGTSSILLSNTSGATGVTINAAGINTITESTSSNGGSITITATEVDGSVSNEIQTLLSTSDATTHTVTLSNSGGSVQLSEGANITLTTTGTGLDGIVTIAAAAAAGTDLSISGTSSPATLNSSTGTDVTITAGGINAISATSGNMTITATEVDGSTTNELQTVANTSDATTHTATLSNSGGSVQFVEGSGISLATTGTSADGIVTIASTLTGLPSGTNTQTLRHNGTSWEASSFLTNTSTNVYAGNILLDGNNIFLPITGIVQAARFRANATGSHTLLESQRSGVRDWQIDNVNGDIWVYGDGLGAYHTYISSLTGYMGLGTSSATQKLHVSGNARVTGAIYDSNNDPGTSAQVLSSTVTGTDWVAAPTGSGSAGQVAFWDGATTMAGENNLWWDKNNDRLGIGTTSPFASLYVNGGNIGAYNGGGANLYLGDPNFDNSGFYNKAPGIGAVFNAGQGVTSDLGIYTYNGGTRVLKAIMLSGGEFGIGTTAPATPLETAGAIRATGTGTATGAAMLELNNTTASTGKNWYINSGNAGSLFIGNPTSADAITINGTTGATTIANTLTVSTATGTATTVTGRTSAGVVTDVGLSGLSLTGGVLTATGGISGLTATRVPFASGASTLDDDNRLRWDDTNKRLSVGDTGGSPSASVHIAEGSVASWEPLKAVGTVSGNMITTIYNAQNSGGASNNFVDLSVGGASAGDPAYRWLISGVDTWSMGVDNSDADKMKWKKATTPSTLSNVGITMTADATPLIGINNDAPSHPLHVIGRATATVLQGISGTPTHTFGAGAGTGPSLGTLTGCTNGFNLQITIGTTPTVGGNIVSVTFPTAFSNLSFPTYSCGNDVTALENAAGKFVISAASATALTIKHNALTPALNAGDVLFFRFNTSGR